MLHKKKILCGLAGFISLLNLSLAYAEVTIPMHLVGPTGQNQSIGTIKAEDSLCGVLLTPNLTHLSPGTHGFHVHVTPSCDNNGLAASGHLDPENTNKHLGPYNNDGHLGDLPVLIVNQDGTATLPTLAPRFKLAQIIGHAFIIHEGSDNYSDIPQKLGGGGARIACGIIKAS